MSVTLRKANIKDAAELSDISTKTFEDAWKEFYKPDLLQRYLKETYNEEKILQELNDPAVDYWVAYINSELAGYVKLSRQQTLGDWIRKNSMEICRIYVYQKFHGGEAGKVMMQKCIEIAKNEKAESLVLGVWENNHRAVAFYKKYGFEKIGEHPFHVMERVDTDWVMEKKLI